MWDNIQKLYDDYIAKILQFVDPELLAQGQKEDVKKGLQITRQIVEAYTKFSGLAKIDISQAMQELVQTLVQFIQTFVNNLGSKENPSQKLNYEVIGMQCIMPLVSTGLTALIQRAADSKSQQQQQDSVQFST